MIVTTYSPRPKSCDTFSFLVRPKETRYFLIFCYILTSNIPFYSQPQNICGLFLNSVPKSNTFTYLNIGSNIFPSFTLSSRKYNTDDHHTDESIVNLTSLMFCSILGVPLQLKILILDEGISCEQASSGNTKCFKTISEVFPYIVLLFQRCLHELHKGKPQLFQEQLNGGCIRFFPM